MRPQKALAVSTDGPLLTVVQFMIFGLYDGAKKRHAHLVETTTNFEFLLSPG